MRLVRVGASYEERREQRLWAALVGLTGLGIAGIALVVCDSGSGLCHPTLLRLGVGFAAIVIALRLGRPVMRLLRRVRHGRRGERRDGHGVERLRVAVPRQELPAAVDQKRFGGAGVAEEVRQDLVDPRRVLLLNDGVTRLHGASPARHRTRSRVPCARRC